MEVCHPYLRYFKLGRYHGVCVVSASWSSAVGIVFPSAGHPLRGMFSDNGRDVAESIPEEEPGNRSLRVMDVKSSV